MLPWVYSGLMPAAATTLRQRSKSARIMRPNSSAPAGDGVCPDW